jgi:hypothetical protein
VSGRVYAECSVTPFVNYRMSPASLRRTRRCNGPQPHYSLTCSPTYPPFRRHSTLENIWRFELLVNFKQCRFRGFFPVGDFQGSLTDTDRDFLFFVGGWAYKESFFTLFVNYRMSPKLHRQSLSPRFPAPPSATIPSSKENIGVSAANCQIRE